VAVTDQISQFIQSKIGQLKNAYNNVSNDVGQSIKQAYNQQVIPRLADVQRSIQEPTSQNFFNPVAQGYQAGKYLTNSVAKPIISGFPEAAGVIPELFSNLNNTPKFNEAFGRGVAGLNQAATGVFNATPAGLGFNVAYGGGSGMLKNAIEGKNPILGLQSGISEAVTPSQALKIENPALASAVDLATGFFGSKVLDKGLKSTEFMRKVRAIDPESYVFVDPQQPTRQVRVASLLDSLNSLNPKHPDAVAVMKFLRKNPEYQMAAIMANQGGFARPAALIGQDVSDDVRKAITGGEAIKQKGLAKRLQDSERYPTEMKQMLAGTYIPKTNKETIDAAKKFVRTDATAAETRALNPQNAVDQAIGAELFNYHMDRGNIEKANQIMNATSGTNEGQMIQILSQYDKTSPSGAIKFAKSAVKAYNETHPNAPVNLPDSTIQGLYNDAKKIQSMPEGRARNIASNELINKVNSLIPSSIADKAITIWKAGLLTSLRTTERNLLGNTIQGTAETIKDIPATLVDKALALKTGKRTTTFTTQGVGQGAKEGIQSAKDIVTMGYDPTEAISKYDIKHVTWGNNPFEQAMKKYTDVVFRSLGAQDKPFYSAAYARSLYNQAGAEAINAGKSGDAKFIEKLVKSPTEDMIKNAVKDANVATFHDENGFSKVANALKNQLSKNEFTKVAGEVLMPFTGVPSSVAGQMVAYSPVGLLKGIISSGKVAVGNVPELQRQAAQEVGRGVLGTGLFGLGSYLMSKGLITGQPKDAAEASQWQLEGKQANSVLVDGKWRAIGSIGPQNLVMLAGAKYNEEMGKPDGSTGAYAGGLGKDFLGQTFLQGVQQPLAAITDPARYGQSYVNNQIGSVVPNIVKDTSKALDPYQREINGKGVEGIKQSIQSGIPLARNKLLPKRDVLGNAIAQEPTGVGAYVDLFNSKTPIKNTVVDELARLNIVGQNATPSKLTNKQTVNGEKMMLTPQQLDTLEQQVGPQVTDALSRLVSSDSYKSLDDEQKAQAIDSVVAATRKKARGAANLESARSTDAQTNIGEPKASGNVYTLISDTGSVRTIDLGTPVKQPTLSGNLVYDKKQLSSYISAITSRQNDIIKLVDDGQLSQAEGIAKINQLEEIKVGVSAITKKGKAAPKPKLSKAKKLTLPKLKGLGLSRGIQSSSSTPKFKLPTAVDLEALRKPVIPK
jgi:hypothetical protein